jgi:enoyl-[acyl-carrier protein] reductase I
MIMKGRRGIIMGLANRFSIAYGIAKELYNHGAELIFTAQSPYFQDKIASVISDFGAKNAFVVDVSKEEEIEKVFADIAGSVGPIDFIVHSIAFSDKNELKGRYCDTSRTNFLNTMNVSCYSFTEVCKHSVTIMPKGGSVVTLTYYGSQKVFPNYNVMAIAKAALEASVIYLASDLGEHNIRVNAISSGPIKTLAASGIGDFSAILNHDKKISPLRRLVSLEDLGKASVFLLSDLSSGVTGEILHVDCGCNKIGCKLL